MKKNSLKIKKLLVNMLIDHKIKYRETDKSIIVPFENGDSMDREPKWFKDFRIKQEAFNENQLAFNKKQEAFNEEQRAFNKNQLAFNEALLACPTIKKEINPNFLNKVK